MRLTKAKLAIMLSKLKVFEDSGLALEQYPTDSEVAADVLWNAYMLGDIQDKTIADLGAGTGILGIGAILLGSKMVYFVEKDRKAISILKDNLKNVEIEIERYEIITKDVSLFSEKVDVVLENPPFGTKQKHSDRFFLVKAFETAAVVYSFHKTSTRDFIKRLAASNHFSITQILDFDFPLKRTQAFHKRRIHRIRVSCLRFENQKLFK